MKILIAYFFVGLALHAANAAPLQNKHQHDHDLPSNRCHLKEGCRKKAVKLDSDLQKVLDKTLDALKSEQLFHQPVKPQDVRRLFEAVSAIYRPTAEEQGIRKFIERVFQMAEPQWPAEIQKDLKLINEDGTGNVVILIPGTGRFKTSPTVALQAHMDMVTVVNDPSGDPKKHFRKGVAIEEKNGWLQSKDQNTTLGADNGVGIAMALRYLDPNSEHPPLELIFTVHEEVGLKGASQFHYPLKSKVLISLDGMIAEDVPGLIYGSSGTNRTAVKGNFPRTKLATDMKILEIRLKNLKGGHSGNDIHRPRWNAVKAFAKTADFIMKSYPGSTVQFAISNSEGAINAIPTSFLSRMAIPVSVDIVQAASETRKFIFNTIKEEKYTDETLKDEDLKIEAVPLEAGTRVLDAADAANIVQALLKTLNGLTHPDPEFPNKMRTSSNLGYVKIEVNKKRVATFESAFMVRSFVDSEMESAVQDSIKVLSSPFQKEKAEVKKISGYSPWLEDKKSSLIVYLMKEMPFFKKLYLLPVGLEPSYFKKTFPQIQVVGISPDLRDAHSVTERVHLDSLVQVTQALDDVLIKLGLKNPVVL